MATGWQYQWLIIELDDILAGGLPSPRIPTDKMPPHTSSQSVLHSPRGQKREAEETPEYTDA